MSVSSLGGAKNISQVGERVMSQDEMVNRMRESHANEDNNIA